ncbi:MAG TPA: VOC family protein, partial [Puia sp.]|nr:VOC family protein [Puia sp.]
MDKAFAKLQQFHVEYVSSSPQTLPISNIAAAGIRAFYFHDPDHHNLELIYFPSGKGQLKWQHSKGNLFLGIDHTAIGISNTTNSLHFYQQIFGLDKKGESWNEGTEQEHLNNVEGARLHITSLRSHLGPGIEFLQYLQPLTGKLYPIDTRADDIWYWQTTLITNNATALYNKLKEGGYQFVSNGLIDLKTETGKHFIAFITKDPDGHAMLIKEYL